MTDPSGDRAGLPPLPLTGVRVVDLTRNLAGPFGTMMLADMGAEVIKVEPPTGDEQRRLFRFAGRDEDTEDLFGMFNRNKRSLALDLKSEDGKAILTRLIAKSDVFIQNSAPGVAARLGFGWPAVEKMNPRIVYVSVSGYGSDDDRRAYDGVIQAATGVMDLNGLTGGPPMPTGLHIGDLSASLFAAFATVTALMTARTSGRGQHIDVAMFDSLMALHTGAAVQYFTTGSYSRGSQANSAFRVPSGVFATRDDRFVFLIGNNENWPRLCLALDLPDLAGDPRFATNQDRVRHRDELVELLAARIADLDADEVAGRLTQHQVPGARVATLAEALDSDDARRRNVVMDIGPDLRDGRQPIRVMGFPYKMSLTPLAVRRGPPGLGEANDYVLNDLLGDDQGNDDGGDG